MTKCEAYTLTELIRLTCERPTKVTPIRKNDGWIIVCRHGPSEEASYFLDNFEDTAEYLEKWLTKGLWERGR